MKNWKQKILTWNNFGINKKGASEQKPSGAEIWLKKMKEKEKQDNAI